MPEVQAGDKPRVRVHKRAAKAVDVQVPRVQPEAACFTVLGPPQPWQRAGRTRKGIAYTQKETKQYELAIKTSAFVAGVFNLVEWPRDARYKLHVFAYFANNRRRDLDNVLKAVCDALNGIAYVDDSQIDAMHITRSVDARLPRTVITLEVLP